ncbi:acyl-CoA dehydrogenase family protein [Novosphingobium rosa]|uniref:acyl-CoA dehydrogenase family protein n=1 Tax=Novosphingobium rosa TaxID=76978 RepID=UPI000A823F6E|nr:acyl-CoA dehydrogenase family protein [Novosphingobium rosa]
MSDQDQTHALRAELRQWLARNLPADWRDHQHGDNLPGFLAAQKAWFARLVEGGYATPHWPKDYAGGGRSLPEQIAIFEELARAGAPRMSLFFVSLYHAAMTLVECGTEAQRARHLPAILKGEIWCQGFSEPGAGSDLASLRTRAVRKGDRYIVSGQKIWSTLGQFADQCLLLVRTDSSGPKQGGITFLLMDMKSKGVEVRPIKQITGDEEFAEIFLDEVEIPVENLVGQENKGWKVAQVTLSSERGLTLVELTERLALSLWRLVAAAGGQERLDTQSARAVVDIAARIEALRAMLATLMSNRMSGQERVGDASILKLAYARLSRDFTALGLRLEGLAALRDTDYILGAGYETGNWMFDFLNSYQYNIAGGSNEIQRNIIAERVLGMPREALV